MRRVVLVRPAGPRNVGMIVRAAANFGPCEIVLVAPERPSLLVHPEFEQMSHGVEGARDRCRVVATLEEALADCTHSVGFTAKPQEGRPRASWRERRAELASIVADPEQRVALVFGAEVGGLRTHEVERCAELVYVETSGEHTSLNLAIAVGVVLSELFAERPHEPRERGVKPLSNEARAYLVANLAHVFGERVAMTPSARRDVLGSIERVFGRARLEDRDARAWHLMMRALGSTLTPKELGITISTKRGRRRSHQEAARAKARVLIVAGAAATAARARSAIAQLGFAVESALDEGAARVELERFAPDLVLVAADVDPSSRERFAALARELRPTARVRVLAANDELASVLRAELAERDQPWRDQPSL